MSPGTRDVLWTILGGVLLVAGTVSSVHVILAVERGSHGAALAAALGIVVAAILLWFASRRSTRARAEKLDAEKRAADEAADRFEATLRPMTPIVARPRPRHHVHLALGLLLGALTLFAIKTENWFLAALMGLVDAAAVAGVVRQAKLRVGVVIGPRGIEHPLLDGPIPWENVREVVLRNVELRGARFAQLSLRLRDPTAYRARRARWRRWLNAVPLSDLVAIPLNGLDLTPEAILRAMRYFHERVLAPGAIFSYDSGYWAPDHGPRFAELQARERSLLDEISKKLTEVEADPTFESDPKKQAALEKYRAESLAELQRTADEILELTRRLNKEIETDAARAREQFNRPAEPLAWLVAAAILAVIVTSIWFGRRP